MTLDLLTQFALILIGVVQIYVIVSNKQKI